MWAGCEIQPIQNSLNNTDYSKFPFSFDFEIFLAKGWYNWLCPAWIVISEEQYYTFWFKINPQLSNDDKSDINFEVKPLGYKMKQPTILTGKIFNRFYRYNSDSRYFYLADLS